MSTMLSPIVAALVSAGATPEMILAAVEAAEKCSASETEARREKARDKKRTQRLSPIVPGTRGDSEGQTGTRGDMVPLKEPPQTPIENNPSTSLRSVKAVPSEQSSSDASASSEAKPAAASAVDSLPAGDLQDFWRIAGALELRKLPRSRAGQLLNLLGLTEALEAIRGAERSRNPAAYVGKTIDSRRKEQGGGTGPPAMNGSMPPWIAARKNEGHHVQREGKNWRVDWALYDDSGECIGS